MILQNGRPAGLSLTHDNKALRVWPCTLQQIAKSQHEQGATCRGEWASLESKCACPVLTSAAAQHTVCNSLFLICQCCLCQTHHWDQTHAGAQNNTWAQRAARPRQGTRNIKALHLLSSMNDGSPGAPSDERSRRCLQADLAPQSRTRGVTFLYAGWLTRAQPLLSFPFYCEEWWLKFPSICGRSCCTSSPKDNGPLPEPKGLFMYGNVMFPTRIVMVVRYVFNFQHKGARFIFLWSEKSWNVNTCAEGGLSLLILIEREKLMHTLYPFSQLWTLLCESELSYSMISSRPSFQNLFSL